MTEDNPTTETPEELPPEAAELEQMMREAIAAKVEQLGKYVAKRRDEAVKARKASGIEEIWREDLEHYEGIDDANREQMAWLKSPSSSGGLTRNPAKNSTRCTSFFPITRQFCESASARMGDILLPAGDWNFAVKATPVPSAAPSFGMDAAPSSDPQAMGAAPVTPASQAADITADMQAKAEKAEQWIRDVLVECSYHTEARKAIEDAAVMGVGILKGPFPKKTTSKKAAQGPNGYTLDMQVVLKPASKRVDPFNFFPDPNCGEDIHSGGYVCERDFLSAHDLKELKQQHDYLGENIDKVLDEGPGKKHYTDGFRDPGAKTGDEELYEVWYYTGMVDVASLAAMTVKLNESDANKEYLPAVVVLVNDTAIKAHLSPLDSGDFEYDVMPWQRRAGHWAGIGVSRQMRTAQAMLNAAARAMMDNAGLGSGPQVIIRDGAITPADGRWELTPRKVWRATEQADVRTVQDAIMFVDVPMLQVELQNIITLAKTMAEEATGIFFLMQGQQGSAPDTVGGMELLHRNASAILRRLARVFDERITEPHIKRYYEWLLLHGPEDAKGDMQIEAIGSTALVEREIQAMQAMQLLQFSLNPAFGIDPQKAMAEVLKSQRFIPDKWLMDEDQKKAQAENPPMVPALEIAKLRAQVDLQIEQMRQQTTMQKVQVDTDRDTAYNQSLAERDQMSGQLKMQELELKRELEMLKYANQNQIKLEEIKAGLASDAMKLRVQKELAGIKQVVEPPSEPPQKAEPGHAYEQ